MSVFTNGKIVIKKPPTCCSISSFSATLGERLLHKSSILLEPLVYTGLAVNQLFQLQPNSMMGGLMVHSTPAKLSLDPLEYRKLLKQFANVFHEPRLATCPIQMTSYFLGTNFPFFKHIYIVGRHYHCCQNQVSW